MAGNKISMLGIVSSTPEQFWRYAPRIALPNSRRPHSEADFRQSRRVFATTSHFESLLARPSGRCGYFLRKPSNRWTGYTPAGWCTRFASKQGYSDFKAYSHANITIVLRCQKESATLIFWRIISIQQKFGG